MAYTAPVVVSGVGAHVLRYKATDVAGNTSPEGSAAFTVAEVSEPDTTPPDTSAAVTGQQDQDGAYVGSATVTITATDSESGVASIEYALDAGAWTRYTAAITIAGTGAHTVRYRATDVASNTAAEKTVDFTVVSNGGSDACPDSDTRATVIIRDDDTGIANADSGNGCTINDLIAERAPYPNHASFVRHVETVTSPLVTSGKLTARQQGAIVRTAARSTVGA
jgi:hypothetical protein